LLDTPSPNLNLLRIVGKSQSTRVLGILAMQAVSKTIDRDERLDVLHEFIEGFNGHCL
jgi:hypothetical protein